MAFYNAACASGFTASNDDCNNMPPDDDDDDDDCCCCCCKRNIIPAMRCQVVRTRGYIRLINGKPGPIMSRPGCAPARDRVAIRTATATTKNGTTCAVAHAIITTCCDHQKII